MKPTLTNTSTSVIRIFIVLTILTGFSFSSRVFAQIEYIFLPHEVGVRADKGDARMHATVATFHANQPGNYRIYGKVWLNSGDDQRNESFYLDVLTPSASIALPKDPNAGPHKVVPDIEGPSQYIWRDCGLFELPSGANIIRMHHYAHIAATYPQFLFGPITTPESVRLVDSLKIVKYEPEMVDLAFALYAKTDSFTISPYDTIKWAKPGENIDFHLSVTNLSLHTAYDITIKNIVPKKFLITSHTFTPNLQVGDTLFFFVDSLSSFNAIQFSYSGYLPTDEAEYDSLLINHGWVEVANDHYLENNFDQDTVHVYLSKPPLPPNHAPIAIDDINNTLVNTPVSGNVLTNDFDPDGDPLTVANVPVLPPQHGSVVIHTDGSFTYTPNPGFIGKDHFQYRVCDNGSPSLCDSATVWIQVIDNSAPNNRPVANDDALRTLADIPVAGNVLVNDFDPDGDHLTVATVPVLPPQHGSVVINPDGSFIYTPNSGFIGKDVFQYRVCDNAPEPLCDQALVIITILPDQNGPENDPPIAADDAFFTIIGNAFSASLASNDFDPNGDALVYDTNPVSGPYHGAVVINANGSFSFTPAPGYIGPDRFVYRVCDNASPALCTMATAYITVLPLPPAPPSKAFDLALTFNAATDTTALVNGNLVPAVVMGDDYQYTLTIVNNGPRTAKDISLWATVPDSVSLSNFSTPPTATKADTVFWSADSLLAGQSLVIQYRALLAPTLPYVPFPLPASAWVSAVNDTLLDNNSAAVTVYGIERQKPPLPENHTPVAIDDINNTLVNTPVSGNVLTNDFDPDGDPLTVANVPVLPPQHGSVVIHTDGSFTYTPNPGFIGKDHFQYRVCDNGSPSLCDSATVWIQVIDNSAPNNRPVANDDALRTLADIPVAGNVLVNDFDPDGDHLTVATVPVLPPQHGSVVINPDGSFIYTPNSGFIGKDVFQYRVCDNAPEPLCDQALVIITILPDQNGPENDPPIAADDAFFTIIGNAFSASLASNDFDPNGDALVYDTNPVSGPYHGAVVINANGSFSFTPAPGYIGPDRFVYRVCDNASPALCTMATAYITVLPLPPAPPSKAFDLALTFNAATDTTALVNGNLVPAVVMGDDYQYTLTIVNNGPRTAKDISLWATVPDSVSLSNFSTPPTATKADTVFWSADSLLAGQSLVIQYRALLAPTLPYVPFPLPASAWVSAVNDTLLDNNSAAVTVYGIERQKPPLPPKPQPYIIAIPDEIEVRDPIRIKVMVDVPISKWDLYVYFEDGSIDSTYADHYISETVLIPKQWHDVEPLFTDTNFRTVAKIERIRFQLRVKDFYNQEGTAEAIVTVISSNAMSLDRNRFHPEIEDPLIIHFKLSSNRVAKLDVYDVAGRHITQLTEGFYPAGWNTFSWNGLTRNGTKVGSGVYIITLRSGEYKDWKKCMIVR